MQSYATKLFDLIELKAEKIAAQWAAGVMKHSRTPSFSSLPKEEVIELGIKFYRDFRQMSLVEIPYEAAKTFSKKYAEECYRKKIPLHEAFYALILMRRHLWLYAEFQGTFLTVLEQYQAVESLNWTILMYDYVSFQIMEKYNELVTRDIDKKIGSIKTLIMDKPFGDKGNGYKIGFMATLLLIACGLTYYYYHSSLATGAIFTHLFYIPIILASIWWGRKGIIVALFLGVLILLSHVFFLKGTPLIDDVIRAVMFLVIGGVVSWLMGGVKKLEDIYKTVKG
jgi:hypothetical protein